MRPATFDSDRLRGFAERLRFSGELLEHDEAVAIASESHTVVHGQPGNRMGGLTTALDHTRGIAPDAGDGPEGTTRKVVDPDRAVAVVAELPRRVRPRDGPHREPPRPRLEVVRLPAVA